MTRKTKLIARVPQALHIVFGPKIDAVGCKVDRFFVAFANGNENDIHDTQIIKLLTSKSNDFL
jgi:hypothetical protein